MSQQSDGQNYNIDSKIVSDCIYLNEFYDWYLRYQPKTAIRKPLALTYKCIVNDKEILKLWKSGLTKNKVAEIYKREFNQEIKIIRQAIASVSMQ